MSATATTGYRPAAPPATSAVRDETTLRQRAAARWARIRLPLIAIALILVAVALAAVAKPRTSGVALAPDNPGAAGSRAAAEILKRQGVEISYVRTMREALRADAPGTTLLVTSTTGLIDEQLNALAGTKADLVLAGPSYWALGTLAPGLEPGYTGAAEVRTAECEDPDALAAGTITATGTELRAGPPGVTLCFPGKSANTGLYAVIKGTRRTAVFADGAVLTNRQLADEGNAALALRALGRHPKLTWYVPTFDDTSTGREPGLAPGADILPPWLGPLLAQLAVLTGVLAWWRARRLGRLVTEPLPVTVRASETTLGRGRLYRRARSRGHAAAALRAGAASRMALRVGLPRSAGATAVIDGVAGATHRTTADVAALIYGPPPSDDANLLRLAGQLDKLESEVRRS